MIKLKREPRLDPKFGAYPYQREAFESIKDLEYSAIFHEQGLGKTKIAIDLILYWLEKREVDTVIIIVKKMLVANWLREIKEHTHLSPKIITQNRRSNFYAFNSPCRVLVVHYEAIISELARFELFLRARTVAVILDESAKIKNPETSLACALFKIAPLFKKRVIMTGTPVANRPYDIWSQIFFLDGGKSLGSNYRLFRKEHDLANYLGKSEIDRAKFEDNLVNLQAKISSFSVRALKGTGTLSLPRKEYISISTDWEPRQAELYKQVKEEMRAVVVKDGMPEWDTAENVLKRLLRLVQIASNPRLIDENYRASPGKLETLTDIVSQICRTGEKCIVWTSFTENVDWLAKELSDFCSQRVHGKLSMDNRIAAIDSFQCDEKVKVLVATPASAKEGLTLTVANHVIFYDRSFSLDDYLQAQDRIHRISQTKTCFIYLLIMPSSIDQWIDSLIEAKTFAAQLSQGDISIEQYRSKATYSFASVLEEILK